MALSKLQIDHAKPRNKPYRLSDGFGLYLLIKPNGSKLWQVRYRFQKKEKIVSLGKYPDVSIVPARRKKDEVRMKLLEGFDPMARLDRKNAALHSDLQRSKNSTFQEVAILWFAVWKKGKTERHAKNTLSRLQTDVYPFIGSKCIAEVSRKDVRQTIQQLGQREVLDLAGRVLGMIKNILAYAADEELITVNPAHDLQAHKIVGKKKVENYSRIDAREIPILVRRINDYEGRAVTRYALKILMLTFVRTSELLFARWNEFDFEEKLWRIPKERMKSGKDHLVPLANQTIRLLDGLREKTGEYEYVFVGDRTKAPMNNNTLLRALERMGYKGKMTGHGFRGLASTVLHENEFKHLHIEKQLAHNPKDAVSHAYNHAEYLKQRIEIMQWWADYIDGKTKIRLVMNVES